MALLPASWSALFICTRNFVRHDVKLGGGRGEEEGRRKWEDEGRRNEERIVRRGEKEDGKGARNGG